MGAVYHLEPKVIEKGEIHIIGAEELYINGIGVRTNEGVVGVYKMLSKLSRANRDIILQQALHPSTTIGINLPGPNSQSNSPIFIKDNGEPDDFRHLAGIEVATFAAIPDGMIGKIIPPSRYIQFSCRADADPTTGKANKVDWEPLFSEGYQEFKKQGCLGYKEKTYSLEIAYRSDGKTIDGYELLIPIE